MPKRTRLRSIHGLTRVMPLEHEIKLLCPSCEQRKRTRRGKPTPLAKDPFEGFRETEEKK